MEKKTVRELLSSAIANLQNLQGAFDEKQKCFDSRLFGELASLKKPSLSPNVWETRCEVKTFDHGFKNVPDVIHSVWTELEKLKSIEEQFRQQDEYDTAIHIDDICKKIESPLRALVKRLDESD